MGLTGDTAGLHVSGIGVVQRRRAAYGVVGVGWWGWRGGWFGRRRKGGRTLYVVCSQRRPGPGFWLLRFFGRVVTVW